MIRLSSIIFNDQGTLKLITAKRFKLFQATELPENIRISLVFWRFQGVQKEINST